MTERVRPVVAAVAGIVLGAIVTISLQGGAMPGVDDRSAPISRGADIVPETFLAWVPRGLPDGFESAVRALGAIGPVAVVAEDHTWLARSWDAHGEVVDRTRAPYRIPIDTIAVEPSGFATFVGGADRQTVAALADGEGVLGATSAALRGLGPGATLRFVDGRIVRIVAVLPDEAVGGAELMVSRETGRAIGVRTDRSLLLRPASDAAMRSATLQRMLRRLLPAGLGPLGRVQVRTADETPLLRPGDAVLSTAQTKAAFGEFAARIEPARPGYVDLDPAWVARHLVTDRVPLLGIVTCHEAVMPQLRGAMLELRRRGLASLIETYDGCLAPRFIGRDPSAMLSHHAWGIAVDLNIEGNYHGVPPRQDPRLVDVMERWGFVWGGRFIVPDGNHFEYRREPAPMEAVVRPRATATLPPPAPTPAAPETPPYYLAWTPGGLPAGFRQGVRNLPRLGTTVVVAGDTRWLTRSLDASGAVVDDPRPPYAIPIDALAVKPAELAPFLPAGVRGEIVEALVRGRAVLGTRSADLRALGVGGTLEFGPHAVRVGAVAPEELIGWGEVLVSRRVGARLGIVDERHLWAFPRGNPTAAAFERVVRRLVPPGEPLRVEAPDASPYMRSANGVHPPIVLKRAFGEFAAAPDPANPAFFRIAPRWVEANLVTRRVPLLGPLTCHREFMRDLLAAMSEVRDRGLGRLIHSTAGCFSPRTVARSPTNPLSFHAYGAAVDINAPENAFGATPTMDRRIVAIFERLGFNWGGRFLIPDGMHFEYGAPPL